MYCEKCGTKMEDGALFCEKCGTKTGAADKSVHMSGSSQNAGANEVIVLLKNFFKTPIEAIQVCGKQDYSMYGMIFLGCKDLFIALLFTVFKNMLANYATGFYWTYDVPAPLVFFVILIMLLVGDGCWIALSIGVYKVINRSHDPKRMIGSIALGQTYIPVIVVAGLIMTALFKYSGANISYLAGIMIVSFVQYECITITADKHEKAKLFYGLAIAAFVLAVLWGVMFAIAQSMAMLWEIY